MAQSLRELELGLENYNFGNGGTRSDFLNEEQFFDRDSGQIGDAPSELRQTSCRKTCLVQERFCFLDHIGADWDESLCKDCPKIGSLWSKTPSKIY